MKTMTLWLDTVPSVGDGGTLGWNGPRTIVRSVRVTGKSKMVTRQGAAFGMRHVRVYEVVLTVEVV